jgi:uncharacterized membrane protein
MIKKFVVRDKRKWNGANPGPGMMILLSILFSCLLLMVRILYTGRFSFLFLAWNLFLAYLPYAISGALRRKHLHGVWMLLAGATWLLLIPNSFYILTDLFHLVDRYNDFRVPAWYDLVLLLSFAWNGLLLGMISVRQMEGIVGRRLPWLPRGAFFLPVMGLNALGVYVGRYLRFNSWDLFMNPVQLMGDIMAIFLHPLDNHYAWSMILCFAAMMSLMYMTLKNIGRLIS